MANKKLSEIEKKKQELEQELASIQDGLDRSIDDVREGVSSSLEPKNLIRKYPLPALGASLLVGFLIGKERKNPSRLASKERGSYSKPESRITSELKRVLAKKGMNLLMDFLDSKFSEMSERKRSEED